MGKILFRTAISLAFIVLLFYLVREDIPQIAGTLKNANRALLALSVAVALSTLVILSKRLQLIFAAEDVSLKLSEALNLTFIGYFFNNFLPTSVGGDIVKLMCASRITQQPGKSVTAILMDRVFGLFTFILIPSLSFLFILKSVKNPAVPIIIYSFLVFSFLFFLLLFNRSVARRFKFVERFLNVFRLGEKVRKVYDGMHNFKRHKKVVGEAMVLSFLGQTVNIFVLYMMTLALGASANIAYFYILAPVIHLLSMLPSLNGLGIREGAYVYFLTPYIGRENAVALSLLWLGLLFILSFIGGFIYLVRHDYHVQFKGGNAGRLANGV